MDNQFLVESDLDQKPEGQQCLQAWFYEHLFAKIERMRKKCVGIGLSGLVSGLCFWFLVFNLGCASFSQRLQKEKRVRVVDTPQKARNQDYIRRRVLILPFINLSTYSTPGSEEIAQKQLASVLGATGEIIVLDPSSTGQDLGQFQSGENFDMDQIMPLARKVGAHGVIVGRIRDLITRKVGDSVGVFRKVKAEVQTTVDLQMMSTKNGKSLVNELKSAQVQEDVTRVAKYSYTDREIHDDPALVNKAIGMAFEKMVFPIVRALRKFSWEGRVALIRGERIFLNAGRKSGLQLGDVLRVTDGREKVFDPTTGKFIGKIKGRMKGTVEVISYFGKDGAVTLVHSGSGFEKGDVVEFY